MLLIVGKVSKTCLIGQYQCDNGDCIDVIFRCDSQQDCFDGSDEKNCRMYIVDVFVCYNVYMNIYVLNRLYIVYEMMMQLYFI